MRASEASKRIKSRGVEVAALYKLLSGSSAVFNTSADVAAC